MPHARLISQQKKAIGKINHEIVILDASSSMQNHADNVVKVTDALISHLASKVTEFPDQETRITVYAFSSESYLDGKAFQCLIWDKDVLRVPSIAGIYRPMGNTALTASVMQAIGDAREIPVQYGDHAFLVYVVTDGLENWSAMPGNLGLEKWQHRTRELPLVISGLPETWTVAGIVPGVTARRQLAAFGFPPGNIEIWDPAKEDGALDVGVALAASSDSYYGLRSRGMTTTDSLFSMNAPKPQDIAKLLTPMTPGSYYFEEVTPDDLAQIDNGRIDQFMALKTGQPYIPGSTYYQMIKRERIQHYKRLAIHVRSSGGKIGAPEGIYVGAHARSLMGLPDDGREVRVSPPKARGYDVYILSTSMNRKLYPGTRVLVMR
jgi:hypothetical protein